MNNLDILEDLIGPPDIDIPLTEDELELTLDALDNYNNGLFQDHTTYIWNNLVTKLEAHLNKLKRKRDS